MSELLTPSQIEAQAKEAGLSVVELCKKAGVAPSTFFRWRAATTSPTLDMYQKIVGALPERQTAAS